jgi:3-isopropylmalate/(R)-2-methylmalate dehydratase large subunit
MITQTPRTFFEKVWQDHVIKSLDQESDLLQIDRLVLHELSGSQALRALEEAGRQPVSRQQVFTVIEHLISTQPGRGPCDSVSTSGPSMIQTTREASKNGVCTLLITTIRDRASRTLSRLSSALRFQVQR